MLPGSQKTFLILLLTAASLSSRSILESGSEELIFVWKRAEENQDDCIKIKRQ